MKKYIVTIMLVLILPTLLLADIAAWVSKADAEKTAAFLKDKKEIKNFCAPCDDKAAPTETIKTVGVEAVKSEAAYWQVLVNGESKDLAYIYYKDGDRWRNVGIAVGVTVKGTNLEDEVPEFIPDAVLKNGE